jgi:hypothetical protein
MSRPVLPRVVTASVRVSRRTCAGSLAATLLLLSLQACGGTKTADVRPAAAHPPPAPADQAPPASPVLPRLERRQFANFALFRTRPEGLPASVRRILGTPIAGMNWGLAQRMPVPAPGSYWLVPGAGYLCIVDRTPASAGIGTVCATTGQALTRGLATIAIPRRTAITPGGTSRLIVGVAPDRARDVDVHTRHVVVSAPVVNGLFVRRDAVAAPPDFLSLRDRR